MSLQRHLRSYDERHLPAQHRVDVADVVQIRPLRLADDRQEAEQSLAFHAWHRRRGRFQFAEIIVDAIKRRGKLNVRERVICRVAAGRADGVLAVLEAGRLSFVERVSAGAKVVELIFAETIRRGGLIDRALIVETRQRYRGVGIGASPSSKRAVVGIAINVASEAGHLDFAEVVVLGAVTALQRDVLNLILGRVVDDGAAERASVVLPVKVIFRLRFQYGVGSGREIGERPEAVLVGRGRLRAADADQRDRRTGDELFGGVAHAIVVLVVPDVARDLR